MLVSRPFREQTRVYTCASNLNLGLEFLRKCVKLTFPTPFLHTYNILKLTMPYVLPTVWKVKII